MNNIVDILRNPLEKVSKYVNKWIKGKLRHLMSVTNQFCLFVSMNNVIPMLSFILFTIKYCIIEIIN
jgi:uncharacterized membrane protein